MNGTDSAQGAAGAIVLFVLIGIAILIYFLPTIVASNRSHPSTGGITALNVFLGWTALGWIIALVWACSGDYERLDAKCPFCLAAIPSAAVRCSHCTSPLAQRSAPARGVQTRSRW
jgi:hypothetical protein